MDRLAQLEAQQEMLARAVAELTAQATVPVSGRPAGRRRAARGATFLRVVRVAVLAAIGLTVIAAATCHPGQVRHRAVPRCAVSCHRLGGRQERAADLG